MYFSVGNNTNPYSLWLITTLVFVAFQSFSIRTIHKYRDMAIMESNLTGITECYSLRLHPWQEHFLFLRDSKGERIPLVSALQWSIYNFACITIYLKMHEDTATLGWNHTKNNCNTTRDSPV